jgi:hypothetical protein
LCLPSFPNTPRPNKKPFQAIPTDSQAAIWQKNLCVVRLKLNVMKN